MNRKTNEQPIKLSTKDEEILTALLGRELYGLAILDALNQNGFIELGFDSLYPALNRLEKQGLISWRWGSEDRAANKARRKYYRVNGLGARVLKDLQEQREQLEQQKPQGRTIPQGA